MERLVGRGEQDAVRVHDVGGSRLAALRILDISGQKAKIDFRHRRARVPSRMSDGDRHEGLPIAEEHRRVCHAPRYGPGEPRVAGEISPAADQDGATRQTELLAARSVELKDTIDGRDLVQQFGVIGASLLDRDDAGARDPADLTLQINHRLRDAVRRRIGLLRHRLNKRGFGLIVADPDLERAVDGEDEHHQAGKRHDVLDEKPPAR